MSDAQQPEVGSIGWIDLTVPNAEELRAFYADVTGWTAQPVGMGEYNDFSMCAPGSGTPIAGVCHARGSNQGLPAQWLIYVTVADLDRGVERCIDLGGTLLREPTPMGSMGRYCVIQDPAGAVAALFEPA